eukprot:6182294-Pleurochrysis_carterae.AAC.1
MCNATVICSQLGQGARELRHPLVAIARRPQPTPAKTRDRKLQEAIGGSNRHAHRSPAFLAVPYRARLPLASMNSQKGKKVGYDKHPKDGSDDRNTAHGSLWRLMGVIGSGSIHAS